MTVGEASGRRNDMVSLGQPFPIAKFFLHFTLSDQKNSLGQGNKYPGQLIIYRGSDVCSGHVGSSFTFQPGNHVIIFHILSRQPGSQRLTRGSGIGTLFPLIYLLCTSLFNIHKMKAKHFLSIFVCLIVCLFLNQHSIDKATTIRVPRNADLDSAFHIHVASWPTFFPPSCSATWKKGRMKRRPNLLRGSCQSRTESSWLSQLST